MRFFSFLVIVLFYSNLFASQLSGKWSAVDEGNRVYLEFLSQTQLRYDGDTVEYKIIADRIRVFDVYGGYVDYPYNIKDGNLYVIFPQDYTVKFSKVKKTSKQTRDYSKIRGDNQLLQGRLCSYSSSYNGGYSHSDRLYFDGYGKYSSDAQTYSTGESGNYVNESASANGGSYKVVGDTIYIQTADGSSFQGKVIEQKSSGRITGINVNGNIFASGLCD